MIDNVIGIIKPLQTASIYELRYSIEVLSGLLVDPFWCPIEEDDIPLWSEARQLTGIELAKVLTQAVILYQIRLQEEARGRKERESWD